MSNQGQTRKRRGISVSLTPNKDQQNQFVSSLRNSKINLQQSHVIIEQPLKRMSVRTVNEKPLVNFSYSRVSKEQEIRQSLALDQQLYLLRKQVQNKKGFISDIANSQQTNLRPIVISPQLPSFKNREEEGIQKLVNVKSNQKNPVRQSKQLNIIQPVLQIKAPNNTENERNLKQNNVDQSELKKNKENSESWEKKKKQLKWAEGKLLQIIRVCDYGL